MQGYKGICTACLFDNDFKEALTKYPSHILLGRPKKAATEKNPGNLNETLHEPLTLSSRTGNIVYLSLLWTHMYVFIARCDIHRTCRMTYK